MLEVVAAAPVEECAAGKVPVREILELLECQGNLGPSEAETEERIKRLLVKQLSPPPHRLACSLIDSLWRRGSIDALLRGTECLPIVIDPKGALPERS